MAAEPRDKVLVEQWQQSLETSSGYWVPTEPGDYWVPAEPGFSVN